MEPAVGFIVVSVVDVSGPAVPDIDVRLEPLGLETATDAQGIAMFAVVPGDYFVDAHLCCQGPGFIDCHVPFTVIAGETERLDLQSCLICV